MKRTLLIVLASLACISATWVLGASFFWTNSIHNTRAGKAYWYAAENGGFEQLTGIPMEDLSCQGCHAATYADGSAVDPATYSPDCADCHIEVGDTPEDAVCLGCHGRQNAEIALSGNPMVGHLFSDVHRDAGMECVDCHTSDEMHGDSPIPHTMFDALEITCETCHDPGDLVENTSHTTHLDDVYCSSCHVQTVVTCANCHFETEIEAEKKRFYGGPPMNDFMLLVNDERTGKVHPATYQSVTYGENTFWAIGPYGAHTVTNEARQCAECHNNENIQELTSTGTLKLTIWDDVEKKLTHRKGVIPLAEDWETAITLDFVRFLGQPTDPINNPLDPEEWEFMETGPDMGQMLFATPLTDAQMASLATDVTIDTEEGAAVPDGYELLQNYPNPFNPSTTIAFRLDRPATISLHVYNLIGERVATVIGETTYSAGVHEIPWEAAGLASGVYIYQLEGEGFTLSRPLTLLR